MSNFAAMLAFLLVFVLTSNYYSSDDDQVFNDDYCANVELWELDTDAGINPYDRAGHPNYKGVECDQEKD